MARLQFTRERTTALSPGRRRRFFLEGAPATSLACGAVRFLVVFTTCCRPFFRILPLSFMAACASSFVGSALRLSSSRSSPARVGPIATVASKEVRWAFDYSPPFISFSVDGGAFVARARGTCKPRDGVGLQFSVASAKRRRGESAFSRRPPGGCFVCRGPFPVGSLLGSRHRGSWRVLSASLSFGRDLACAWLS